MHNENIPVEGQEISTSGNQLTTELTAADAVRVKEEAKDVGISVSLLETMQEQLSSQKDDIKNVQSLLVVGFVALIIIVASMVLDQLHFNNQVYQDGYLKPVPSQTKVQTSPEPVFKNLPSGA